MTKRSLAFLRGLIAAQTFADIWFLFSPDMVPESIRQTEFILHDESYFYIASVIGWMANVQAILCLLLFRPTKIISVVYFIVAVSTACLGASIGTWSATAIDMLVGYFHVLASGAMLGILWVHGYFSPQTDMANLESTS